MLSIVLSDGGLHCLAMSEVTSAGLLRPRLTLRRLVACLSADIALSREFSYILVLLLLLRPILWWLLALALWLLWAEARLLRLCARVVVAPRLLSVARWITTTWIGRASSCSTLLGEEHFIVPLSPLCCLVHGSWVLYVHPISCRGLQTRDVPV